MVLKFLDNIAYRFDVFFDRHPKESEMGVKTSTSPEIVQVSEHQYDLFDGDNLVGTYSRRRDAVRGARRRGLNVS